MSAPASLPPVPWPPGVPKPEGYAPGFPARTAEAAPRNHIGQFEKGAPGRPRGAKGKATRAALEDLERLTPVAIENLGIAIRHGSIPAIKLLFEHVLPKGRTVELPGGLADPKALVDAVANGELSVSEFAAAASALKAVIDASELVELKGKLDHLEQLIESLKK